MPHWGFHELQYSISELVVHGARNQPSERSGIVVEIYLPDTLAQSENTLLIFQRTNHRFGRSTEIRLERKPFGMVPFRFDLFRHVDYNDGTVHGGPLPMGFALEKEIVLPREVPDTCAGNLTLTVT
jgi:hypothetical protein